MSTGELLIRPYRKDDRDAWLDLMAEICWSSPSWEAVYLEHPSFHASFDLVAESRGRLVGILAGHLIEITKPFWSAEILGVHPEYQRRGIARAMLAESQQHMSAQADRLVLWTRCQEARDWYRREGFTEIDQKGISPSPLANGEVHILKSKDEAKWPLWAFALSLQPIKLNQPLHKPF